MTTDTTTAGDVTDAEDVEQVDTPESQTDPGAAEEDGKPGREAAKYRRQLRETQTNLENAQARLTGAQGQLLATIVSGMRVQRSMQLRPEAVHELVTDALFNDDGTTNQKALQSELERVFADRPYLFEKNLNGTGILPDIGTQPERGRQTGSWTSAFRD